MLSKSDYLRYLEAPLHLWASKHDRLDQVTLSRYDQHLMEQGVMVEKLAREFLTLRSLQSPTPLELKFEQTLSEGHFQARLDALVYDAGAGTYDIYEIKSSSSVKKEHLLDAAFQRLVAEANFPLRHTYLLHINKEYTRQAELQIDQLFLAVNVDAETEALRPELLAGREAAWRAASADSPDGIEECLKPKDCPCPSLCHPGLPEYSIFDLPRLHHTKARQLKSTGVLAIQDIPQDFPLSERQQAHRQAVHSGKPQIDRQQIKAALAKLEYPLYFLDYETFNPAVPDFEGYRPYQHLVFQYSLDIFPAPDSEPVHHEFLYTGLEDPARPLLEHLLPNIGSRGSVIVWNKGFEASRNREMADRFPEYAARLDNINTRLFDLMEIFSQGHYIHADFHGSASIKNVLPVLVPDHSYAGQPIPKGDEAMMAWLDIIKGRLSPDEAEQTRKDLLRYCALDTLAMVKNWQALQQLIKEP